MIFILEIAFLGLIWYLLYRTIIAIIREWKK